MNQLLKKKDIVLCAGLNEESINNLGALKGVFDVDNSNLHIVHCFEVQVYTSEFAPFIFPTEDKYPEIEEATKGVLKNLATTLVGPERAAKVSLHCLFSTTPKQRIIEFMKEMNADLAVVATKGSHGLAGIFHSSFAEYLMKFSPCDVYVTRNHHQVGKG